MTIAVTKMHKLLILLFMVISTQGLPVDPEDGQLSLPYDKFAGINPADIVVIGDRTYYFSPRGQVFTSSEAIEFCNSLGSKLVSFETEEEWLLVKQYMYDVGLGAPYWSSGQKYFGDSWIWSGTGQEMTYFDWFSLEPDSLSKEVLCIYVYSLNGWYDDECDTPSVHFICEF